MPRNGRVVVRLLFGVAGCLLLVGCGGGVPMGKVAGKVTYNSQPVKDGDLTFVPISGPRTRKLHGHGSCDHPECSLTATTTKPGDGLGVGKYSVSFNPRNPPWEAPENDGSGPPPESPKSEYAGLVPKETQVEIKSGTNDLNIELVAGQ